MKSSILMLLSLMVLLSMTACGKSKTVHCDRCDKEISIEASSNMTDDWIICCSECEEEVFGDEPVVSPG